MAEVQPIIVKISLAPLTAEERYALEETAKAYEEAGAALRRAWDAHDRALHNAFLYGNENGL